MICRDKTTLSVVPLNSVIVNKMYFFLKTDYIDYFQYLKIVSGAQNIVSKNDLIRIFLVFMAAQK